MLFPSNNFNLLLFIKNKNKGEEEKKRNRSITITQQVTTAWSDFNVGYAGTNPECVHFRQKSFSRRKAPSVRRKIKQILGFLGAREKATDAFYTA